MRRRAFRPEVPCSLEGRVLLSGAGGLSTDPVILSARRFTWVGQQIVSSFWIFKRHRNIEDLRSSIADVVVVIPFGRVDGLGVTMNRVVTELRGELAGNVPRAISSARNEILTATRAQVSARVEAGDVIVR